MKSDGKVFVRNSTGLTRQISGWDALVGNGLAMGVSYFFVFAFFASLLYPGVNLPVTVLVTLVPGIIVATIYYLFTISMPRTGGDYVWISRVVHPLIGFTTNFLITFTFITSIATAVAWSVSYGLGPMLAALGLLNSDPNLISLSSTVTSPPTSFILTVVLISLFTLPILLGTRNAFRIMWALFAISIIGTVVTVIAFYSTPQSAFIANFNRLSGMNYQQAITDAAIPLGFTVTATLTGSIFTITDFLGFYTSAYFAGEVKQVNRSQLIAMYGSLFVIAIVSMLIYGSVYYSVGSDFLNAISLLSVSGAKSYTLPALPVINFLVVFASPNPFVVIMSGLALIATGLAGATVFVYICVRNLFAWSFDRIMPSGMAALDSKRGTPYVAILVIYLSGVAMAAAYYYTPFFTYYVYATFNFFLAFILVSIGAVVFPYRAKSIFDASPALVRKKFGGIPMISILGIVSIIVNAYLAYATFQPAVTPAPSGPPLVQLIAYALVPMTVMAAVIIYAIAYAYRSSRGMNLKLVFSQIPPE